MTSLPPSNETEATILLSCSPARETSLHGRCNFVTSTPFKTVSLSCRLISLQSLDQPFTSMVFFGYQGYFLVSCLFLLKQVFS